jgi:hypothetical protein
MKADITKTGRRMSMGALTLFFVFGCLICVLVSPAGAYDVYIANTTNSDGQDKNTIEGWVQELGNNTAFSPDGYILAADFPISGAPWEDREVWITNKTERSWWDLYYVAEPETSLTNYDQNLLNDSRAFRIDNLGLNTPLISESLSSNLIFEPDEVWKFVIRGYVNSWLEPASWIGNPGVPGPSGYASSGSIIATPEPATLALLGLGGLMMFRRRKG